MMVKVKMVFSMPRLVLKTLEESPPPKTEDSPPPLFCSKISAIRMIATAT